MRADEGIPLSSDSGETDSLKYRFKHWGKEPGPFGISRTRLAIIFFVIALLLLIIIVAVVVSKKNDDDNSNSGAPWQSSVRLTRDIVPELYVLTEKPDLVSFQFSGSVDIYLNVLQSTPNVVLHSVDLSISNIFLTDQANPTVKFPAVAAFPYEPYQFYIMQFGMTLQQGSRYILSMDFAGNLTDVLAGFYRSSYVNAAKQTKWIATTQFEATDARRAFPCFDEPAFKANFTFSMILDRSLTALANMNARQTTIIDSVWKRVDFYTSVRMSTYLVAFIACDFAYVEMPTVPRDPKFQSKMVRVWAPPDKINQSYVALKAGAEILAYYELFFDIEYPLPKQDMVAIPDFSAGAMENWGLITYRETALLFDPAESSATNLQRVVVVVAHELAHQWFGNYVTMDWWSGLWLNEGFASFVEYMGTDEIYKNWDMWGQFIDDTYYNALVEDASLYSHPVVQPVDDPAEIASLFDSISYDKGACLIRMIKNIIGDVVFQQGLHDYLSTHAYGNAATEDLWAAWTAAAQRNNINVDVGAIMDGWTSKMGYPYLQLTQQPSQNGMGVDITATQIRFLLNPLSVSPPGFTWDIQISYKTQFTPQPTVMMMSSDQISVTFTTDSKGWIKLDLNETGYYRVNYPASNWDLLAAALMQQDPGLSIESDRAGIVNDVFSLAEAGILPITQAMNVSRFLALETSYTVWTAAAQQFSGIGHQLDFNAAYYYWQAYMQSLLTAQYTRIGWNTQTDHLTQMLQSLILSWSCNHDVGDCRAKANALFQAFMADPVGSPITPDVRNTVYYVGIEDGGEDEWNFLFQRYQTTDVSSEAVRCLAALARSRTPWLLARLLSYSLDQQFIRLQDALSVISYVSANPVGQQLAWQFVVEQWDSLFALFLFSARNLLETVTSRFNTQQQLDQVQAFIAAKSLNEGTDARSASRSVDNINMNIHWMQTNFIPLQQWLMRQTQ